MGRADRMDCPLFPPIAAKRYGEDDAVELTKPVKPGSVSSIYFHEVFVMAGSVATQRLTSPKAGITVK